MDLHGLFLFMPDWALIKLQCLAACNSPKGSIFLFSGQSARE